MDTTPRETTPDLVMLTTTIQVEPGLFAWDVPDGWQQGRGAFGGLVMAAVVRTVEAHLAAEGVIGQPLRAVTATMCGAVLPGPATLRVALLRRGSGTTTASVQLMQGAELRTHVIAVFGKERGGEAGQWQDRIAPERPDWRDLPVAPIAPPLAPVFTQHCAFRPTGPMPFSGATHPLSAGWVNFRLPGAARDAAYIAALVDTWWPASFCCLNEPRPMATLTYTLQLVGDLDGLDPDAPVFYHATAPAAAGGYISEVRTLWGEDGRLLAVNPQTICVIR